MYQTRETPETFKIWSKHAWLSDPGPDHTHDFQVYHRNTLIAHVIIGGENGKRMAQITNYVDNPIYKQFKNRNMTLEDLTDWIVDRLIPETRGDIDWVLSEVGLSHYSPIGLLKRMHGVMFEDFIWVRFKGENHTFDEVKMRN